MVRSATNSESVLDTAIGIAARPAPGVELGANDVAVPGNVLAAIGAQPGDVAHVSSESAGVWARLRASREVDQADGGAFVLRLGRMLWPQLGVKPGQPLSIGRAGALPVATELRLTPPFNLTFKTHERMLARLREERTPLYPGMRVLADVFSGGAGMIVRVDSVTPSPAILGEDTEVELHKADPAVSERQVGLADVGGMEPIVKRLRELVELPLLRPGFYRRLGVRPPKGVLLYGPPGTGKTLTCRALANELGVTAFKMSSTELVGNVQGETEANLRLLFSRALAHAPSLVLIDEFDVIATHRERLASQSDVRAASQLLSLMDGLEEVDGIVLVATTNRVQAIDPAFRRPGRFEEEIFVGPPSEESRAEILSIHTREMPLSRSGQEAIGELAAATGGFVGADIMHLARSAGLEAARRLAKNRQGFEAADFLEGQHVSIEREDFENALRTVRPSVLRDVVTRMERIAWPQIAGLSDLKDRLVEVAGRALDLSSASQQGVLLYGPPGSGKSAIAHALATELGANLVTIEGSRVFNQWLGESEEAVRALFRRAHEARPAMLLLDQLDALAPVRAGETGERTDERVVSALMASLDDVLADGGVFVVGITSRPELIDPAIIRSGRLGLHLEVPLPDADRRRALVVELAAIEDVELDPASLDELVEGLHGWSAADVAALVREAAQQAALEHRDMTRDDIVDALPSMTRL